MLYFKFMYASLRFHVGICSLIIVSRLLLKLLADLKQTAEAGGGGGEGGGGGHRFSLSKTSTRAFTIHELPENSYAERHVVDQSSPMRGLQRL